ncbi:HutD family protein [Pleomorphomonas sp. NRK KF1]|uniref:HutD/Ves family protein n=1 Tax=Pleomorphomonas sp. NRK KF1 TaxID=2943000 RepID=UPI002042BE46|nr:HutD family protein [Pleomorphomonas sp. NRK KF1]MCM5552226.1 HutD family protein [Pleomorphomonas sp. NRK KF1]
MSLRLLTAADFRRLPWQNGRGTTLELVRHDDATDALLWRLSIADVVEPGPFSPLPGIDRVITLIDGDGFDLDFGGAQPGLALRPFEPLAFSGDWRTTATAVHGPSRDFNVMTARGKLSAEVEVAGTELPPAELAYVYAARGGVTVTAGDRTVRAEAGELIECRGSEPIRVEADEPATVLAVRLCRVDGAPMPGK